MREADHFTAILSNTYYNARLLYIVISSPLYARIEIFCKYRVYVKVTRGYCRLVSP